MQITAVEGLLIRHFGDEAVVFDPLAWDAHLLNPAAIAVLELLLEAPHSDREITEFLADSLNAEERPRAADHARRLIGELRSLGLVRSSGVVAHAVRRDS